MNTLKLPNERTMPVLGLGTWDLRGEACFKAVETALRLGYRHIDTAEMYDNEDEIGKAILHSGVPREEIFITTKVWTNHHHAADFKKAAEQSLKRLKVQAVDLLLIHWPNPAVPLPETIGALNQCAKDGKALSIGVSNFSVAQMKDAVLLSSLPLACNQIPYSLASPNAGKDFLTWLKADGRPLKAALCAYSPLGRGSFLDRKELKEIGKKQGKTPAQVALKWLIRQEGVAAIPKAAGEKHLRENLELFDFDLDQADLKLLAGLRN